MPVTRSQTRAAARLAQKAVYAAGKVGRNLLTGLAGAAGLSAAGSYASRRFMGTRQPTMGRSRKYAKTYRRVSNRSVLSSRKRKGTKGKNNLATKVRRILSEGKSIGTYEKVIPSWRYHLSTGGNVENRQGVHEFYFCQPLELLDAASVLFNSKTASANYATLTNNFSGDPDFIVKSGTCHYYITNTSQFDLSFDVYNMKPVQDSQDSPITRWTSALDEVAGAGVIVPQNMYINPQDGSGEFGRYYSGVKSKKVVYVKPGQRKCVSIQYTGYLPVNWEAMKYGGDVISFKKGVTQALLLVQKMPVMYDSTGNKIGIPTTAYGGFALEQVIKFKIECPNQAAEAQNVDKLFYFNNFNTGLSATTTVFPAKPQVANIPVIAQ